mgnify:CR=1 FL=1
MMTPINKRTKDKNAHMDSMLLSKPVSILSTIVFSLSESTETTLYHLTLNSELSAMDIQIMTLTSLLQALIYLRQLALTLLAVCFSTLLIH